MMPTVTSMDAVSQDTRFSIWRWVMRRAMAQAIEQRRVRLFNGREAEQLHALQWTERLLEAHPCRAASRNSARSSLRGSTAARNVPDDCPKELSYTYAVSHSERSRRKGSSDGNACKHSKRQRRRVRRSRPGPGRRRGG